MLTIILINYVPTVSSTFNCKKYLLLTYDHTYDPKTAWQISSFDLIPENKGKQDYDVPTLILPQGLLQI